MSFNYRQYMAKVSYYKKAWLNINPDIKDTSGIYILTRNGEDGLRYAYVGQAKRILTRLAEHRTKFQHIDLSIRKHGLYHEINNPYGWSVVCVYCSEEELDEKERLYIKTYSDYGFQLRNKTSGGQDKGKTTIVDDQNTKGYHDGLKQGYKNCLKDIKEFFTKYLDFEIKPTMVKKNGEYKDIAKKKFSEFSKLLDLWQKN